jgi:hypothetical protein
MMRLITGALALLSSVGLALAVSALPIRSGGTPAPPPPSYVDFCSTANVSCASAMSIEQRLVATAPATAYVLTLVSNSATQNIGYVGPTHTADTATAIAFCLSNGGTTTNFTPASAMAYTQYNDCRISQINDQTANGCNPSQATQAQMLPFDVRADGKPASINPNETIGPTAAGSVWLSASGCAAPCPGTAARSAIIRTNTLLPWSDCCGTQGGCAENAFSAVNGTMFNVDLFSSGSFHSFGADIEGGGACNGDGNGIIAYPPPAIDGVGIVAYNGTNATNIYFNNSQVATNCTPFTTINSQHRFLIGIAGDSSRSGPTYFRSLIFTSNDVSQTVGLPTQIYNYLSAL